MLEEIIPMNKYETRRSKIRLLKMPSQEQRFEKRFKTLERVSAAYGRPSWLG